MQQKPDVGDLVITRDLLCGEVVRSLDSGHYSIALYVRVGQSWRKTRHTALIAGTEIVAVKKATAVAAVAETAA